MRSRTVRALPVLLLLALAALIAPVREAACPSPPDAHHPAPASCAEEAACVRTVAELPVVVVARAPVTRPMIPAPCEQRRPPSVVLPVEVPPPRA